MTRNTDFTRKVFTKKTARMLPAAQLVTAAKRGCDKAHLLQGGLSVDHLKSPCRRDTEAGSLWPDTMLPPDANTQKPLLLPEHRKSHKHMSKRGLIQKK